MPKKKKSKKQLLNNLAAQGVMMNNFFPALEGQNPDEAAAYPAGIQRDPRYPKFGLDNIR
jgi:hypothetical protein